MKENQNKYRPGKWLSAALVFLAIALFMVLGFRLLLQSNWLFDKLTGIAVEQVNQQIHGHLDIGQIRGDLRNGFVIYDLNLTDIENESILRSDSITVEYHWMNLIRQPYELNRLELSGVNGVLVQESDSTWNVMKLLNERDELEEQGTELPNWEVRQIQISGLNLDLHSEILLPDGFMAVEELAATMSAGYRESGVFGSVSQMEFKLNEARLPQNIGIELSGVLNDDKVTLESLLFDTGRSYLKASGIMEGSEQLSAEAGFSPISWEDLILYIEDLPLREDLNMTLSVSGRLDDLEIQLSAESEEMRSLNLNTNISLNEALTVRSVRLDIEHLNLPDLTGEKEWPVIETFRLDGDGMFVVENPEQTQWKGNVEIAGFSMAELQFDHFQSGFEWAEDKMDLNASVGYQDQTIGLNAAISSIFEELPAWNLNIESEAVNLAVWLDDPLWESDFKFNSQSSGAGFDTDAIDLESVIQITDARFGNQKFERITFEGSVTPQIMEGGIIAEIEESRITADVNISDWNNFPVFEFKSELNSFNIAEIDGFEAFPTYINGSFSGEGSGFDPGELTLFARAELDSSIVNDEMVEQFNANLRIEENYLYIDEGSVQSPIADASLTLRHHLSNFTDIENRFSFNATLKDLTPLAPLFGVGTLEADGDLTGRLSRNSDGILTLTGDSNLQNVIVDTLFSTDEFTGKLDVLLLEHPEADLQVELKSPKIMNIEIQDLNLISSATIREDVTQGNMNLMLNNGNESSLNHKSEFIYSSDEIRLLTSDLEFITGQRTLALTKPFELIYKEDVLQSDTLSIATENLDSHLNLWIPHLSSNQQHIGLDATNLNLGILQETILGQSYFESFLSGEIELQKSPDKLFASATGTIREFGLEAGEMDSLKFEVSVIDEWLDAGFDSWHNGQKLLESTIRCPYLPGDPLNFDDQFFERPISGSFELLESNLSYWFSFLPDGSPEETDGLLSMQLDLAGSAQSPELTGNLNIENGLFSGIRIDRMGINLDYQHADSETVLNGLIIKDQQQVMEFDSRMPFLLDLKRAEIIFPSDDDEISATIRTNDFDLAMFNNYMNRNRVRGIAGRLDGNLNITGELAKLRVEGNMNLTRGAMRIVPAGINLTEIRSNIIFEPNRVNLQQFTMRSGPGTFRASGTIELQDLQPGEMDLELVVNQFRAANTSDYNAIINSRSRITGDVDNPRLSGTLTFLNGFINLQNFGERSVETVVLEEETEAESNLFYENLAMEMDVNFSRQFFIRNRQYLDMEIELGGQVDLLKEKNEDIQVFGTLEGVRGFARPLGKNFELDEANVSFSGPVDNPQLNIVTQHEPPQAAGVIIYYIIDGTLLNPEFRFDSTPEMELQDIISYTLFGKPFYGLESWEQVVAGSGGSPSASDYALDVLLDRVEMIASQRLGIDVVQIDNTRSGSSNTTSITTGWYLNQKTFFAILNEVGGSRPKTLFLLEYLLTENLELIIMQGDDSRGGVDLRWKKDY